MVPSIDGCKDHFGRLVLKGLFVLLVFLGPGVSVILRFWRFLWMCLSLFLLDVSIFISYTVFLYDHMNLLFIISKLLEWSKNIF